jgi:hypothetical protein
MTQLLTSWVCDVCSPPGGAANTLDQHKDIDNILTKTSTGFNTPTFTNQPPLIVKQGGFDWYLWARQELQVPNRHVYYCSGSFSGGSPTIRSYNATQILRLENNRYLVRHLKNKLGSLTYTKISKDTYEELEHIAIRKYNPNTCKDDKIVYFLVK